FPNNTDRLFDPAFATTASSFPSLLRSPNATKSGVVPVDTPVPIVKLPVPLPSSGVIVFELAFDTTRSRSPSPLRSPTATDIGSSPGKLIVLRLNPPAPLPISIDNVLE